MWVPDGWVDRRNYRGFQLYLQEEDPEKPSYEKKVVAERSISVQALNYPRYIDPTEAELMAKEVREKFEETNPGMGAHIFSAGMLEGVTVGEYEHPAMRFRMSYNLRDKEILTEIIVVSNASAHWIIKFQDLNRDFESNLENLWQSILTLTPIENTPAPTRKTPAELYMPYGIGAGGLLIFLGLISMYRSGRQKRLIKKVNEGNVDDYEEDNHYGGSEYDDEPAPRPKKKKRKPAESEYEEESEHEESSHENSDFEDDEDDYEPTPPPKKKKRKPAPPAAKPPRRRKPEPEPVESELESEPIESAFESDIIGSEPESSATPESSVPPPRRKKAAPKKKPAKKAPPPPESDFEESEAPSSVPPPRRKKKKAEDEEPSDNSFPGFDD